MGRGEEERVLEFTKNETIDVQLSGQVHQQVQLNIILSDQSVL